jgi:hypothetical protein
MKEKFNEGCEDVLISLREGCDRIFFSFVTKRLGTGLIKWFGLTGNAAADDEEEI